MNLLLGSICFDSYEAADDCMSSETFVVFVGLVNGKGAMHNNAAHGLVLIYL